MIHITATGAGLDAITDPNDEVMIAADAPPHVHAAVEARFERARQSFAWSRARADMAARNLAENLRTGMGGRRRKTVWSRWPHARSVSVVGAGPSLDLGRVEYGDINVMIAASASAADPNRFAFGEPGGQGGALDGTALAVIAETLPIPYLDRIKLPIVCGITADPAVFARAEYVYVRADSAYARIARELNAPQVADGLNVVTTMLALCDVSRVDHATLYGVDLCTSLHGEVYARGTPWSPIRSRIDGDVLAYDGIPAEHNNPHAHRQKAIAAVNVNDEPVTTTPEWLEAKRWIETFAQRSTVEVVNRSGGLPLELAKRPTPIRPSEPVWPVWTDDLIDDLRIARNFEAAYPEVAIFTAAQRVRLRRDINAIESLQAQVCIYRDAVDRLRRGWV